MRLELFNISSFHEALTLINNKLNVKYIWGGGCFFIPHLDKDLNHKTKHGFWDNLRNSSWVLALE